jgi:hypothetical protein
MSQGELFRWSSLGPVGAPGFFSVADKQATDKMNDAIARVLELRQKADELVAEAKQAAGPADLGWACDPTVDRSSGFQAVLIAYQQEVSARVLLVGFVDAFRESLAAAVQRASDKLLELAAKARKRLDLPEGVLATPDILNNQPGYCRAACELLYVRGLGPPCDPSANESDLHSAQRQVVQVRRLIDAERERLAALEKRQAKEARAIPPGPVVLGQERRLEHEQLAGAFRENV